VEFHVHILVSQVTGRCYVGSTGDLPDRLSRHNSGQSKATKHGAPWRLAHCESYDNRSDAVRRERFLKTGTGREELERILSAERDDPELAQPG
jgi:putative endonuclease